MHYTSVNLNLVRVICGKSNSGAEKSVAKYVYVYYTVSVDAVCTEYQITKATRFVDSYDFRLTSINSPNKEDEEEVKPCGEKKSWLT
jgi:hypothetical protein